jgi:retron-type reverse transcriptase
LKGNIARNKRGFVKIFPEVKYTMDKIMNLYNFAVGLKISLVQGVVNYIVLIIQKHTKQPTERIRIAKKSPKVYHRRVLAEFGIARSVEIQGRRKIHSTVYICRKESSLPSLKVFVLSGINYLKELEKLKLRLNKGLKANNLSCIMSDPNFFIACWFRICSNNNKMIPAFEKACNELKKMNWFEKVASGIKNGSYNFKPIRKTYVSKFNSKQQSFMIPSLEDKIVQEGMRFLLELIYELKFLECSYAWKTNKNCHKALIDIQLKSKAVNWYVKGVINEYFSMIDHRILVSLIQQNVDDQAFIDLLFKYMRIDFEETFSDVKPMKIGLTKNGILSPILANIYMHFFDEWVINDLKVRFDKSETIQKYFKQNYNKLRYQTVNNNLMPTIANDFNLKRLWYFRYADNIIIGVEGSKQDALTLKFEAQKCLDEKLKLTLNVTKTFITHAEKEKTNFLGYRIYRTKEKSREVKIVSKCLLDAPINCIVMKLMNNGYIKRNGLPTRNSRFVNLELHQIIDHYKTVERDIFNYYLLANNYKKLVSRVHYILKYSCVLTIASKMRLKTAKGVFRKYGKNLRVKNVNGFVTYFTPSKSPSNIF